MLLSYANFLHNRVYYELIKKKDPKSPCPLEDQDILLEAKLDHSNFFSIARVLKFNPYDSLLFVRTLKPSVQLVEKMQHMGAIVGVDDLKLLVGMAGNILEASDWFHGGDWERIGERGVRERRPRGGRRREMASRVL